ncbi:ribonuclease P protein component [Floccifex sp.]|uniref:ribonuclease P protein component n=1 Tax=Floccifex sp. TaxID=2815810 RepID=UPI002A74FD3A|nr:ribonuclease P protein component [Floccifex sp.]MDD7280563.1 ribonuclease P protein component [Erysipelotrichaceae bacterium]MDY2958630.1 ribonuclease P protein component [Floccifex sp.]
MKKEYRICKNYEFSSIIHKQNLVKSSSFVCYYLPKKEQHNRIGISVSKKLGNAVCRNKIKRQVRSMVDLVFDFEEAFDVVIIVRPVYKKKTFGENCNELKENREKMKRKCKEKRG